MLSHVQSQISSVHHDMFILPTSPSYILVYILMIFPRFHQTLLKPSCSWMDLSVGIPLSGHGRATSLGHDDLSMRPISRHGAPKSGVQRSNHQSSHIVSWCFMDLKPFYPISIFMDTMVHTCSYYIISWWFTVMTKHFNIIISSASYWAWFVESDLTICVWYIEWWVYTWSKYQQGDPWFSGLFFLDHIS